MRQALGDTDARLEAWEWHSLRYHAVLPGRLLARVTGSALVRGHAGVRWSSVVKLIRRTEVCNDPQAASANREILAYRSGLLSDLAGPLRAPRLLGIDEDAAGVWLWLEDLRDAYGRHWPLEQFELAGRHLGLFNGGYLVSRALPTHPWLNDWLTWQQVELRDGLHRIAGYRELQLLVQHPRVQRVLGPAIASRTAQLLADQAVFLHALSQLPQTLCHHESSLANLFAVRRRDGRLETVAVDWEQVGPASIGVDIATLVFGTLRRCEFDAERATELDERVFRGYVSGLREAGWEGRTVDVRLGFTAAVAVRWRVMPSLLRGLVDGAPPIQSPSQGWQVSPDVVLAQWIKLCAFLLDRADEARQLIAERPPAH